MNINKLLTSVFVALILLTGFSFCTSGCLLNQSQQRKTVNTLFSVGHGVDKSYRAYLDLVVSGELSTNSVPTVAKAYNAFQLAFNSATLLVANSTNVVASQEVLDAAAGVSKAINQAKGK